MGDYTELVLKCEVARVDVVAENILQHLLNGADLDPSFPLPEHMFFQLPRWSAVGRCSSYYHTPFAVSRYENGHIFSRSDLKNYSGEIEAFLDWLGPYVSNYAGQCIGWIWYEYWDQPELVLVKRKQADDA